MFHVGTCFIYCKKSLVRWWKLLALRRYRVYNFRSPSQNSNVVLPRGIRRLFGKSKCFFLIQALKGKRTPYLQEQTYLLKTKFFRCLTKHLKQAKASPFRKQAERFETKKNGLWFKVKIKNCRRQGQNEEKRIQNALTQTC